MRTAQLDGAHIEYFRGIANPVGIKVGQGMTREWIQDLVRTLNPHNEPGRLTLIHRFGAKAIDDHLPALISAVRETGSPVLWVCDPMHGNTESTADGTKTRRFDNVISELESAFRVHQSMGSYLGGVHLELTGENVTECTGGARGLTDGDLARAYKSTVDPRLNYEQAMEVAMRIAGGSGYAHRGAQERHVAGRPGRSAPPHSGTMPAREDVVGRCAPRALSRLPHSRSGGSHRGSGHRATRARSNIESAAVSASRQPPSCAGPGDFAPGPG